MVDKVNFENLSIEKNIKNFIDYIRFERQLASNTIFSYKRDLNKYKLFLSLKKVNNYLEISHDQILSFLEYLNENYCGSSISRILSSSRNFYKFLVNKLYTFTNRAFCLIFSFIIYRSFNIIH